MIIPEEVIAGVINNRLTYIRNNPTVLNDIFENLSNEQMIRLSTYVTGDQANNISAMKVIRGYPQSIAQLPSYVIVLGKDDETETGLNNFISEDHDPDTIQTQEVTDTVKIASRNGQKYVQLSHEPQSFVQAVYIGTTYTNCFVPLTDPSLSKDPRNVALVIPGLVNMTDIQVTYQAITGIVSSYGSIFTSNYMVQVWTQNGDLTVWLYHLLKWMFQLDRNYLTSQGFLTIHYGGGEFEPYNFNASDSTYPAMVYRRAFTLDFRTETKASSTEETINGISTSLSS